MSTNKKPVIFTSKPSTARYSKNWKISIDDGYAEYEYLMPISGDESIETVAAKIAKCFKVKKPDGKMTRGNNSGVPKTCGFRHFFL